MIPICACCTTAQRKNDLRTHHEYPSSYALAINEAVEFFDTRVYRIDLRNADALVYTGRLRRCARGEQQCRDQQAQFDVIHDFL